MTQDGRWSEKFKHCVECGTDKRKHRGHGLCENCYGRKYYRENPARKAYLLRKCREWMKKHPKRTAEIQKRACARWLAKFKKNDPEEYKRWLKKRHRKYFLKNREKIREQQRIYYLDKLRIKNIL